MNINKRQLKKWIAALDSGEYKQGHGEMQDLTGYCCLGVGCRVLIPDDKLHKKSDGRIQGGFPSCQFAAPKWLKQINKDFKRKTGDQYSLANLNDQCDFSFPEIATLLELVYIHKILD